MTVKRWSVIFDPELGAQVEGDLDGDYVNFDDYDALLAQRDRLLKAMRMIRGSRRVHSDCAREKCNFGQAVDEIAEAAIAACEDEEER